MTWGYLLGLGVRVTWDRLRDSIRRVEVQVPVQVKPQMGTKFT